MQGDFREFPLRYTVMYDSRIASSADNEIQERFQYKRCVLRGVSRHTTYGDGTRAEAECLAYITEGSSFCG